jgi:hypothetical protein
MIRSIEGEVMGLQSLRRHRHPAGRFRQSELFQELESRTLLSTIYVTNYGAVPNDNNDDRAGIVAAINASNNGDTIFFPAGTYRISQEIASGTGGVNKPLGRGRVFQGTTQIIYNPTNGSTTVVDGTVLLATGTDPSDPNSKLNAIFHFRETNPNPNAFNVKFTQLTFRGRGMQTSISSGMVEGMIVDNCHFDITNRGHNGGIELFNGLRQSSITNNVFNVGGENGIYGYNWDRLTIANNMFLNASDGTYGGEGMHLIAHSDSSSSLLIEQNFFSGLRRMGAEIQGGGINTIVQDNWYEYNGQYGYTADTMAYSIINDRAQSPKVLRNYAKMPKSVDSVDGIGVRIIFEIGGKNLLTEDNYSDGGNHVIAGNGSGATGNARNNKIMNYREGPRNANGATIQFSNNNANVTLTWDPVTRGKPGPNHRYGQSQPPPPPPPPELPATPINLSGQAVGYTQINLSWIDQASNETGFRVEELASDGITWVNISGTLAADTTSFSVTGLTAGTTYHFRVFAFNENGDSENPSNQADISTTSLVRLLGPTNLVGTVIGLNRVDLTWTDNDTQEDGFYVERLSEDGITWVVMATLPADTTYYSMTSLAAARTYSFRVAAFKVGNGQEPPVSNIATVQTPLQDVAAAAPKTGPVRRTAFIFQGTGTTGVAPPVSATS